jgi:hypothetical protein
LNADKIFSVLSMIVVVAGVTTVVSHGQSAAVIRALGDTFSSALRAAQGN